MTALVGCVAGIGSDGRLENGDCTPALEDILDADHEQSTGSRTSTPTAFPSSANTGSAWTTETSSSGNAARLSGSSTNVSLTRLYVYSNLMLRRDGQVLTRCCQNLEKKIPDQPTNVTPVELRSKQIFADVRIGPGDGKPFISGQGEAKQ